MQEMNEIEPGILPGGGLRISSDRDDRMEAKIKTRISSDRDDGMEAKIKTQKNPCTKI